MESKDNEKDRFKRFDIIYIRLCSKQTNEYMECLDKRHYNDIKCEELKEKYLNCIYYNVNKIK